MAGFLDTKLYSPTLPILARNPEPKDAAALSAVFSNPENIKFDPMAKPLSAEQALGMLNRMRESAAEPVPTRCNLVVVILDAVGGNELETVGFTGFGGIDIIERNGKTLKFADVGIMLNPSARGKGYAVEAMRLSVNFALDGLKTDGVSCQTAKENKPMLALIEKKFGWKRVGDEEAKKDVRFEVFPEEWKAWEAKQGKA